MNSLSYSPRLRPERLIAAGRVVLAVSSLFAVWLDPSEPAKNAQVAYSLLAAYVVYSTLIAGLVWRVAAASERWRITTHAADLLFFSLFMYFTKGPSSPFMAYFVFALVCATLRWQWRGTMWTAAVALTAFFGLGFYFGYVLQDPAFDLHPFIIRGVYLAVVAVLLGYLGAHEQRTLREVTLLASWPQVLAQDAQRLVRELLGYAAPVLEARRVLMTWAEAEEPWLHLASWYQAAFEWHRDAAGASGLVDDELRECAFLSADARAHATMVRATGASEPRKWTGEPLDPAFRQRFAIKAVLSLPLRGETFEGRLFFLDKPEMTSDDLLLGEIVAGIITARLDYFYLTRQLKQAAATEERIRLARDLHDGVLQSFTGIALRLAAVRRLLEEDRGAAQTALEEAQRVIASEQRDLRFFIQELRPLPYQADEHESLSRRLRDLATRMEREWDLRVELDTDGLPDAACGSIGRDIYHIVREALVNAVRHGDATRVRINAGAAPGGALVISVLDNGRGFPFAGRYSAEELARLNLGPKTLRERVLALNGSLIVESNPSGAQVHVALPLAGA